MYIRPMKKEDVSQVAHIDREAFPTEWPPTNFKRELENHMAYYIVASKGPAADAPLKPAATQKQPAGLMERIKNLFKQSENDPEPAEEHILGYAGMWILADEAHIMSIASAGEYRRRGIGEALLIGIIELARKHRARTVTLEVRVSNTVAQNLYLKYSFRKTGLRKGYYLDNREDALIMSTDYINSTEFKELIQRLTGEHIKRWGETRFELEK
jgi:ribosomal-protein-alanine N-acetyltransferase